MAKPEKVTYWDRGATFSEDGQYRYRLWRRWDPSKPGACFVMYNPSTADSVDDDATIRKCVGFARRHGFGEIEVVNLFALRARNPKVVADRVKGGALDAAVGPDNDAHLIDAACRAARVFVAWGGSLPDFGRAAAVRDVLATYVELWALHLTGDGKPWHPRCAAYANPPVLWAPRAAQLTGEQLRAHQRHCVGREVRAGKPLFMGLPDHWYEPRPTYRCRNHHVSQTALKSEARGALLCLACGEPLALTFPGDQEGPPSVRAYPPLPVWPPLPRPAAREAGAREFVRPTQGG
jgi:hypothetical protein